MRFSGDKMAVKQLAKKLGIPVVPASDGILDDADKALDFAKQFGYPVLTKVSIWRWRERYKACA